jgi:hypothetical protein
MIFERITIISMKHSYVHTIQFKRCAAEVNCNEDKEKKEKTKTTTLKCFRRFKEYKGSMPFVSLV